MSVKFQITLPEDLADKLRRQADQYGVPLAEFIRDTMRAKLKDLEQEGDRSDPLAKWRGAIKDEEPDLAAKVEDILYGESVR